MTDQYTMSLFAPDNTSVQIGSNTKSNPYAEAKCRHVDTQEVTADKIVALVEDAGLPTIKLADDTKIKKCGTEAENVDNTSIDRDDDYYDAFSDLGYHSRH